VCQGEMKKAISASRRTDLVAFFTRWLAAAIRQEKARVHSPSGHSFIADLSPRTVHTFVLWSKDYSHLLENHHGLRDGLKKYDQVYFHFTVTGLGGSFIERGVPEPDTALSQLEGLIAIAGTPRRISVRLDPVVHWEEEGLAKTNFHFIEKLAGKAHSLGITDIRTSFAQWYGKAVKRAEKQNFRFLDPSPEDKREVARQLAQVARVHGLALYACSQNFLGEVPGIRPSACIDGKLLQELHPNREPLSQIKDKSQRQECLCTESVDIGSYTQICPHACLYCYANPRV